MATTSLWKVSGSLKKGIGFFEKRSWTMQPIKIKQISKMNRS